MPPQAYSGEREQHKHIKADATKCGKSTAVAEEIAAHTVNEERGSRRHRAER
jgi:hypothetical protein